MSNPGNNLYVTGLSTRVTVSDLEKFFSKEGKVWNVMVLNHVFMMCNIILNFGLSLDYCFC